MYWMCSRDWLHKEQDTTRQWLSVETGQSFVCSSLYYNYDMSICVFFPIALVSYYERDGAWLEAWQKIKSQSTPLMIYMRHDIYTIVGQATCSPKKQSRGLGIQCWGKDDSTSFVSNRLWYGICSFRARWALYELTRKCHYIKTNVVGPWLVWKFDACADLSWDWECSSYGLVAFNIIFFRKKVF